jgi:transposase
VEDARRAQVVLNRAEGVRVRGVAKLLGCSTSYVQRLITSFQEARLVGLLALHKGRRSSQDAAEREARILEWTRRGPDDGSTHWSSRRLAAKWESLT